MPNSSPEGKVYKEGEPCSRYHVWLYDRDKEWFRLNVSKVKYSEFVRACVRKVIRSIEAKAMDEADLARAVEEQGQGE